MQPHDAIQSRHLFPPSNPMFKVLAIAMLSMTIANPARAAEEWLASKKTGDYVINDFTFHTGEKIPAMKVAYATLGDPKNPAILVLHGTTGSHTSMLNEGFGGEVFRKGGPLDAEKYFIVLPDAIGLGGSSKPSDGMKASFPRYNYQDMVLAQHELLTKHLGVKHLRTVIGNSMGGMIAWVWGVQYPDYMDSIIPMASLPGPMSARNWMMRRMVIDSVRNDPAWMKGDYTEQPPNLAIASVWFGIATNGGDLALQKLAPNSKAADELIAKRMAASKPGDANDVMYRWDASRDFDPSADLEKIKAHVLIINAEDDERNPPELPVMADAMKRLPHAQYLLIPTGPDTVGHNTVGQKAKLYLAQLADFMAKVPSRK